MTSDALRDLYERFFTLGGAPKGSPRPQQFRRRETSLRFSGCKLLADLVELRRPRRVLDLGSGMTSIVLRTLQREYDMLVVTTDTSQHWLDVTVRELQRDGLNAKYCYEQTAFERIAWEPFDLVSVDCGNAEYRLTLPEKLASWCAKDGIIVCDDYRLRDYGPRMAASLRPLGFTLVELPETIDEYGQTLAIATRRGDPVR